MKYNLDAVFTLTEAARILGLPRRTAYGYLAQELLPVTQLSRKRVVMNGKQLRVTELVLRSDGKKGIREGLAVAAK